MAPMGPEAVELLFARRLPQEVAEHIYGFGFHIWLSRPFEKKVDRELGHYRELTYVEQSITTYQFVLKGQLSESARRMFWAAYAEGFVKAGVVRDTRRLPTTERALARPFVIYGETIVRIDTVQYRGEWLVVELACVPWC